MSNIDQLLEVKHAAELLSNYLLDQPDKPSLKEEINGLTVEGLVEINNYVVKVNDAKILLLKFLPENTFLKVVLEDREYGLIYMKYARGYSRIEGWKLIEWTNKSGQDFVEQYLFASTKGDRILYLLIFILLILGLSWLVYGQRIINCFLN